MRVKQSYFICTDSGTGYSADDIVRRTITNNLSGTAVVSQTVSWYNMTTKANISAVPSEDREATSTPTGTTSDGTSVVAKTRRLYVGTGQSNMVNASGSGSDVINGATDSAIDGLYMWTGNSGNPNGTFAQADLAASNFGDKLAGHNSMVFQAARAWVMDDPANREAYIVISGKGGTSMERRIGTDADLFVALDRNVVNARTALDDPDAEIVFIISQIEAEDARGSDAIREDRKTLYRQLKRTSWYTNTTKTIEVAAKNGGDDAGNVVLEEANSDGNIYTAFVGGDYTAVGSDDVHYNDVDLRALGLLIHQALEDMELGTSTESYRAQPKRDSLIGDWHPIDGANILYNKLGSNHAKLMGTAINRQGRFVTSTSNVGDYSNRAQLEEAITFLSGEAWSVHIVAKITAADTTVSRGYLFGRYDNQNVLAPSGTNDVFWPRKTNSTSWDAKIRNSVMEYTTWDDSVIEGVTGDIDMDKWVAYDITADTVGNFNLYVNAQHISEVAAGLDTASLTVTTGSAIADGDTVTIGSVTYTFKDTIASAFDVKIGGNTTDTLTNLMNAISGGGTIGTDYGTGTTDHPNVSGVSVGSVAGGIAMVINGLTDSDRAIQLGESSLAASWNASVTSGGTAFSINAFGFDFDGEIKEIKIFGKELSPDEVTALNTTSVNVGSVTTTQRLAISDPFPGMVVFDTTVGSLYVYTDAGWAAVNAVPSTTSGSGTGRTPAFYGLKAWSILPETAGTNLTTTAGTVLGARVKVDNETTIENICTRINATATGMTGCYMGVYDSSGTLIAQTANDTVNGSAIGDWIEPVLTPVTVDAGAELDIVFLSVGASATLIRAGSSQVNSFGKSGNDIVFFTADTGVTTLPTTLGAKTKLANSFFMAIS